MGGISGNINFDNKPVSEKVLHLMNSAQTHNNINTTGYYFFKRTGLAYQHPLTDLKNQPLSNEDKTVWTVFNGEIYNYSQLKLDLEQKGHKFKTDCDAEIIVHAYEEYGERFPELLNGMFALAVFDQKTGKLMLIRDRTGQKPLYWFKTGTEFVFASELGVLKHHPNFDFSINYQSLHDFLSFQYVPPPFTIYNNVFKLLPGKYIIIQTDTGIINENAYWSVNYHTKHDISLNEAKEQLKFLLTDAVKKRLADVPSGVFMSEGTDSAIIAGLMSGLTQKPVKLLAVCSENEFYDERKYINTVAESVFAVTHVKPETFIKVVNPDDFEILKKLVIHQGEPYGNASMLPAYFLSEFAKTKVTTALSGYGADELFAGHYRYLIMKTSSYIDYIPVGLRKKVADIIKHFMSNTYEEQSLNGKLHRILNVSSVSLNQRYMNIINRFNEKTKFSVYGEKLKNQSFTPSSVFIEEILKTATALNITEKYTEFDLKTYLPADILIKTDIASAVNSLELRNPFMDYRIVEFAASLPLKYKLNGNKRKYILRKTFSEFLPANFKFYSKKSFGVPVADLLGKSWNSRLKEYLLEGPVVQEGFFNKKQSELLIKAHENFENDYSYQLWSMLIFAIFLENEKDFQNPVLP